MAPDRSIWRWLPDTHLIASPEQAREVLEYMRFPFISKSKRGSASKNVRMIETRSAAEAEIALAFGGGLPAWGEPQQGYLIWQEVCPGNRYDYRVNIVGREMAIGRRWNKPDTIFASGHSRIDNCDPDEAEPAEVLEFCKKFFETEGITFAAIDIVKGSNGWKLLETSIAWPEHHLPWQTRIFVSGRPCRDLFAVIVEEMEAGSFDAATPAAA